jgi:phosphonoacetaldehyde hydrolase
MEDRITHPYPGPIRAVVFDWAGTTVDFGSFAPMAVFLRLFESRGVSITPEEARSGMGLMKKDHLRFILSQPRVAAAWNSAHNRPCSDADIEDLFADFTRLQIETLKLHAQPVPGLFETLDELKKRGIKCGSTTGYTRAMMDVLVPEAARLGYQPDCVVCPDDVPAGRPYPWMCYLNAIRLGVFPMQSMVKVGDTLPDVQEGINAGMWVVGVTLSGNLLGLSQAETQALSEPEKMVRRLEIEDKLYQAGAHTVIDGIWDLPQALDEIEYRMSVGECP